MTTEAERFLAPTLLALPAQLIAYHMSVARGIDPDFPQNLSKTLTVDYQPLDLGWLSCYTSSIKVGTGRQPTERRT